MAARPVKRPARIFEETSTCVSPDILERSSKPQGRPRREDLGPAPASPGGAVPLRHSAPRITVARRETEILTPTAGC